MRIKILDKIKTFEKEYSTKLTISEDFTLGCPDNEIFFAYTDYYKGVYGYGETKEGAIADLEHKIQTQEIKKKGGI